jgi:nitrite reductase/ring-hydroxylating ferredoxin subunit
LVTKHVIGTAASVPPGSRRTVEIGRRAIVIFNVDGTLYALRDRCPHQGACLSGGALVGGAVSASQPGEYEFDASRKYIRCPWHGWEYELATGQSYFDPGRNRVRSYDVRAESGKDLLDSGGEEQEAGATRTPGPYSAETVPVTVDGDYIVLEL